MQPDSFCDRIRQALERRGFEDRSGAELLDRWEGFVDECENGYGWTIFEYDDEIGARDYLDAILNDPAVAEMPEVAELEKNVRRIDERFRALLQTGIARPDVPKHWWRRGVLKFAGEEYRFDMANQYSIHVDPTEGS